MTDNIDDLKTRVTNEVHDLIRKAPTTPEPRIVQIIVALYGKHPGPSHEADTLLNSMLTHLARAAIDEFGFRVERDKLPAAARLAYGWSHDKSK